MNKDIHLESDWVWLQIRSSIFKQRVLELTPKHSGLQLLHQQCEGLYKPGSNNSSITSFDTGLYSPQCVVEDLGNLAIHLLICSKTALPLPLSDPILWSMSPFQKDWRIKYGSRVLNTCKHGLIAAWPEIECLCFLLLWGQGGYWEESGRHEWE